MNNSGNTHPATSPEEVLAFLSGSGPLEGCWFGDKPSSERGNLWWRKYLPLLTRQPQSLSTSPACPECGWPNGHDWQCKHSTYKNAAWNKPSTSLSDALARALETARIYVAEKADDAYSTREDDLLAVIDAALAMKSKEQSK